MLRVGKQTVDPADKELAVDIYRLININLAHLKISFHTSLLSLTGNYRVVYLSFRYISLFSGSHVLDAVRIQ